MMQKKPNLFWMLILLFLISLKGFSHHPATIPFSRADSLLADSVLSMAFRNEALYSLQGDLKPISTVHQFSMQLDSVTLLPADSSDFNRFRDLQRIANWLSNEEFCFVVIPFTRLFNHQRTMQILVVNREKLARELEARKDFWFFWGLVPESPPEVVITVVENAEKYRRFEGYGYLFGYPQYAVDFFVEAARSQDETGEFVQRSFFQMPVYTGQDGRFVYAVPKDAEPAEEDLVIRLKTETILNRFVSEFEYFKTKNPYFPFLRWYLHSQAVSNW